MNANPIELFTIGFAGKSAQQFFTILGKARVRCVIDVRLHNTSHLAGYTKRYDLEYFLRSILNANYVHLPVFSPTKQLLNGYKKGEYSWHDYEQQYHATLTQRQPQHQVDFALLDHSCMLCAEPIADQCHRRLAAEYLQQIQPQIKVTHL